MMFLHVEKFVFSCDLQDFLSSLPFQKAHKQSSAYGNSSSLSASGGSSQHEMPEVKHGHESSACKALLTEHFDEICCKILAQRISRSPYIQQILPKLLPRLAAFNKEKFMKKYVS